MKRFLSLLLALAMLVSGLPVEALALSGDAAAPTEAAVVETTASAEETTVPEVSSAPETTGPVASEPSIPETTVETEPAVPETTAATEPSVPETTEATEMPMFFALRGSAENFSGKVISIMGDSISTFAGYIPTADGFNLEHLARYPQDNLLTDVNETWWMQVITELDAKLGINDSWRGATLSGGAPVTTGTTGEKAAMSNLVRIQNLGANGTPDIILLYGGTNDLAHVSKVGSFNAATAPTSVDLTTAKWDNLADGFVHTLLRMRHYYPNAQIVALLPAVTTSYYSNEKLAEANAVMAQICQHYGIPYTDLRECGITTAELPDGIHPNAAGMDYITAAVLDVLLSQCEVEAGENKVYSVSHKLTSASASKHYYKGVSAGTKFEETVSGEDLTVTVTMGGADITSEAYADGKITISNVTGDIVVTAKAVFSLGDRLLQLPEKLCAGLNLWTSLEHDEEYYTASGWGVHSSGKVYSVTFPVSAGDRLWATSFQSSALNGSPSSNGIRVTYFSEDGMLDSLTSTETYNELTQNGYLTVPEQANAVNIPMWTNEDSNELYLLNAEHSYENGKCTICGEQSANFSGKVISILSASTSTFAGYIPEADGFNLAHRARYPQDDLLTDVNETWWMQAIHELDAKLGINDSWAGSQVLNTQDTNSGDLGPDAAMASLTRIQNLGANGTPDVILFFGAGNDMGRGVTAGSFDPATAPTKVDLTTTKWNSLADAYVAAIMRLQHFYPDSEILVMTTYAMPSYVTEAKLNTYGPILKAICDHYGVKYLDLRDCGVTFDMLPDNIHPNAEGMDYITKAVVNTLTSEFQLEAGENKVYSVTHNLSSAKASKHYYKGVSAGAAFEETVTADEVTVTMGGKDITASAYANGKISIANVTGDIVVTAKGEFDADGHLQQLPAELCAGTNLWKALQPGNTYYTATGWGNTSAGTTWSITFPVKAGDRVWATSLGAYPENGSTANGVRVTWFNENGVLATLDRNTVYNEFAKNGYITAPEGAVALNVPMTENEDHYAVYLLSAEHSYENGKCAICGEKVPELSGKTISILGASISTYEGTSNGAAADTTNSTIRNNVKYYPNNTIPEVGLNDTWWMQVAEDLDLRLLVNNAWSGSAILLERSGTVGAYVDRCVQLHDNTGDNVGEEPDIICIQMGFNDFSYGKDTLGDANIDYAALITADGYGTPSTTMEATAIMLDKITKRYPNAEVYMFNHFKRIGQSASDTTLMEGLNASIQTVCDRFGVTVVDLYTALTNPDHIGDGKLHPNRLGMDVISEAVKSAIIGNTDYEVTTHTAKLALDSVTADYGTDKIMVDGTGFSVKLTAPAGDTLSVTVTMGGKDITADCYYAQDGKVSIAAVTGDVVITAKRVHTPKDYRWEFNGTDLAGENTLTKTAGTTTDGIFSTTRYDIATPVVLSHEEPWVVEWKSEGTFQNASGSGARVFTTDKVNANYNARYIFKSNTRGIIAMGEKTTTGSHNYGIALADHGIDWTALHTYRLENRIAQDGSNMIYLLVDGQEIGPMTHYFVGTTDKNTTSQWLSGKDFVFPYMGTDSHGFNDCAIEYIAVWEGGHEHVYESVVTQPTCTEKGYTTHTCACGDSYVDSYVDATGHSFGAWTETKVPTCEADGEERRNCESCDAFETRAVTCGHNPEYSWDVDGDGVLELLAIGNSFSVDALEYLWQIANDLGIQKVVVGNFYISGCTLKTHAANAANDAAAYTYYYNDNGVWSKTENYKLSTALTERSWDYISMQQSSRYSGMESTYNEDLTNLISYVKGLISKKENENRNPCAKLVWHMTWAYQQDSTNTGFANYNNDQMTMYNAIVSAVQNKIVTNTAFDLIVPNGTAVQNSRTSLLGDTTTRDGYHMSRDYGRYLTGLLFVKTVTGLSVDGITYAPSGVDAQETAIAIESVNNAYANPFEVTKSAYTGEVPEEGYILLQSEFYKGAFWDSTSATGYNKLFFDKSISQNYFATIRFTKETLPVGSIIILADGWRYRPDGWITDTVQTGPREPMTTESYVVVTEEWWGDYTIRAFNICRVDGGSVMDLTENEMRDIFRIYVPEESHVHTYTSVVTAPTCTEKGYTTHTCAVCGDSYVDSYVDASGHSFGAWKTTTEATCTEKGEERRDCANCDHFETREIAAKGHTEVIDKAVEATCTEPGKTEGKHCSVCETVLVKQNVIPAKGHSYESVVTEPTCTEKGYTTHTCTACGDSYVDSETAALGHKWDDGKVTREPTETVQGEKVYTCTVCGETRIEILPVLGHEHSYTSVVTKPTCTEKGYTTYTCACGHSYTDNEVPALGHTEIIDKAVEPTCTEPGLTEGKHCSVCGAVLVKQNEIPAKGHSYEIVVTEPTCTEKGYTTHICTACDDSYVDSEVPATGHSFGAWKTTTEATCTEKGEERRDCANCDHYETREIAAKGHAEVIDKAVEPTCTETGLTEGKHCSVCGTVLVKQKEIPAKGHSFGAWKTTTEATCTEKREERRDCANCDHFETREMAAKGHTEVIDKAVEPTCTESGLTEGKHCSVCGTVLVKQNEIPAKGHSFGAWKTTTEATCTEKGEERRDCANCDHFETREIAAKGHTKVIDKAVEPTCTETGLTEGKHCSACKTVLVKQNEIPAKGHSFGAWSKTKAATCTEKGEERRDCANCDHFETREIAAKGHTEVIDKAVEPTCTETGLTEGKHCSVCGTVLVKQNEIPAKGHSYGAWKTTTEATCTEKGEERRDCANCDHFETREIAAKGHSYGEWVEISAPTCTEAGEQQRKCVCGHSETRSVEALGHEKVIDEGLKPTCTEGGISDGKHCGRCGEILKEQVELPAAGHSYSTEPKFLWIENNTVCKAYFHCSHCDAIKVKVCTVTTDTENNKILHTATVEFEGKTFTDVKEEELEDILWGDANGDGKVNTKDATRILRYYAELISDSEIDLVAADVNSDGNVNTKDATRVLRYYAELIDSLRHEK